MYNNSKIWEGYQILKQHFPNISINVESFFEQLSRSSSDPEIQSNDGIHIDVLWDNLILSISDDRYAVSTEKEFEYFDTSIEAVDYILKFV